MDNIISKVILGLIRHILTTAGGGLVAHGLVTGQQWSDVVGAIMVIVPVMFSAYDKWQAEQARSAAVEEARAVPFSPASQEQSK